MPRFVILEHQWNGVHWDLMLEQGEALATWAIDAPIVDGVDLPARSLASHRRHYLDYEGPISGDRGTVRRVDRGTYEAVVWSPDRIVVQLQGETTQGTAELWRPEPPRSETLRRPGWIFRLWIGKLD